MSRSWLVWIVAFALVRPVVADDVGSSLAALKLEEAQKELQALEATMDRLSRLLAATEPQNAIKLRSAFRLSRERLIREGMSRIAGFLREKKLDRALEDQELLKTHLAELLDILLEKDIDPRELIRHIRGLRDVLKDIDQVVKEETAEKLASDNALAAKQAVESTREALARLDNLVDAQKALEKEAAEQAEKGAEETPERRAELARKQEAVREQTSDLKQALDSRPGEEASSAAKSLAQAEAQMSEASRAMKSGASGDASKSAVAARKSLEEARARQKERLERLRAHRDFVAMKKQQDATKGKTDDVLQRMKRTPPLIVSPQGGVPGRQEISSAAEAMENASGQLSGGDAAAASNKQEKALDQLQKGREKTEQTLAALQQALRERVLTYLEKRITVLLKRQKRVSRATRSLDGKLRALAAASGVDRRALEIDRKDLRKAQSLSEDESALAVIAEDVIDLLHEDGTTLVFPRIVGRVGQDLLNVQGLLAKVQTGVLAQRIQKEVETTLEEILAALEEAQKSPPPPSPNQGRESKNGTGPLLPTSTELKMVLSMQIRVNERTRIFDSERSRDQLDVEEQRHAKVISGNQKEIRDLMRKIAKAMGE